VVGALDAPAVGQAVDQAQAPAARAVEVRLRGRLGLEAAAAVGHDHADGIGVDLHVEHDPVLAAAVPDAVRQELTDQQLELAELFLIERALQLIERMAPFTGGLRSRLQPQVQPCHDFVAAEVDRKPAGRILRLSTPKARKW
jgi:hypothetical protein